MYKSNKYSAQKDAIIEGCAMVKLAEASDALTLDEIICGEPLLTGVSTQKLARVMMKFVDMGFVVKSKRRDGRMVGWFIKLLLKWKKRDMRETLSLICLEEKWHDYP